MYPTGAPQAGQYISPELQQALQSISSSQEDQQNLQQQMKLAQQMRAPSSLTDGSTQMAGKVAIRKSPLTTALGVAANALADHKENQTLDQMKQQAAMLRDARGRIISAETAAANAQTDPSQNHPDTNAALGVTDDAPTLDSGFGMGSSAGSDMMPDV